jgi:hypothetical protein
MGWVVAVKEFNLAYEVDKMLEMLPDEDAEEVQESNGESQVKNVKESA